MSSSDEKQVAELKKVDSEVREHEAAHLAASGGFARGGPTYQFKEGPDGRQYAVAGEVQIDTSSVPGDPRATIRKLQTVRAAALAPANPSGQDLSVAAEASAGAQKAYAELSKQKPGTSPGSKLDVSG